MTLVQECNVYTFQTESDFIQFLVSSAGEHSLQLFEVESSHVNSLSSLHHHTTWRKEMRSFTLTHSHDML